MNKLVTTFGLLSATYAQIESAKSTGNILELVTDDNGDEVYWIMAPKPGYDVPFDLRSDELLVIYGPDQDFLGIRSGTTISDSKLNADFWNIGGDEFNNELCSIVITDDDADDVFDTFLINYPLTT
jgi:hypothetical protein